MKRILDLRGSGKTKRLMLLAKENDYIFVCFSPYLMQDKAYRYGITGIQFVSYSDFLNKHFDSPYVIDELEPFLRYTLSEKGYNTKMAGYTLSVDD